jgi:TFIIF-interacting CTD phosphatase-like protein
MTAVEQRFIDLYNRVPTQAEFLDICPPVIFNMRPFVIEFLSEMSKYYEIVIFTAAEQSVSPFSF